jgi:hypothetical protein
MPLRLDTLNNTSVHRWWFAWRWALLYATPIRFNQATVYRTALGNIENLPSPRLKYCRTEGPAGAGPPSRCSMRNCPDAQWRGLHAQPPMNQRPAQLPLSRTPRIPTYGPHDGAATARPEGVGRRTARAGATCRRRPLGAPPTNDASAPPATPGAGLSE